MRDRLPVLTLVLGITFLPLSAHGQWQPDGVPIATAASNQWSPTSVSDGAGGAIVTWVDERSGAASDIYAQRVDAVGALQWSADGIALCTAANTQEHPTIVSDGAGGAIVTWEDHRNGPADIYAQRVSALGVRQWTPDGVALCTTAGIQRALKFVSDGTGGAIVTWEDYRSGSNYDIYSRRVDASGVPQWTADGVALCTAASEQYSPTIVSDGAEGAIVTWYDFRSGSADVYAQRVNASGAPQWTADGLALCTAAGTQSGPRIVSDGAGGAIVTWSDYRGTNIDVYARRVDASGVPQWTADGVALCAAANHQYASGIVSDGAGGMIVTWYDFRSGSADLYARRVDASGVPQWTVDGVALCTAANDQIPSGIVSDGAGGAIITWKDERSGYPNDDIYARRVNASGAPQWTADGVALCTAAHEQSNPTIVSDGVGGAIVTWEDRRSGDGYSDIYAQHVTDPLNVVAIVSFDATEMGGVVTLRSAFRSDLGVESVNVYRAVGTVADLLTIIERVGDVRGDRFEYVDQDVAPGETYRYRIGVVDADGEFFSPIVTVSVGAIAGELSQNQPNPFNPTTTIRFVLPVREDVMLAIYDANGRLVRTLMNEVRGYGAHEVTWDGRDDNGATMGSGVYFYRLRAGKHSESKKMVLLK